MRTPALAATAAPAAAASDESARRHRAAWPAAAAVAMALLGGCSDYDGPNFSTRVQGTPLQVDLPAAAVQASAGWAHTCAVLADGSLHCWGDNTFDQLGNGGQGVRCFEGYGRCSSGPVAVSAPPASWTRVSGGLRSTCGIDATQATFCWGEGDFGQLGQGVQDDSEVPVAVNGALSMAGLGTTIGADLACGITTGNELHCWGAGDNGQPGDGSVVKVAVAPYRVGPAQSFSTVSVGERHACALDAAGQAFCWGDNRFGQVGDGTQSDHSVPTAALGGQVFTQVAAGLDHTCALDTAGQAFCWGAADQLGRATSDATERATPAAVAGSQRFVAIAAGGTHTCGIEAGGALWCWGDNSVGQFGDGTVTSRLEPTAVTGLPAFTQLLAGGGHTCGLTAAGELFCWGANSFGQAGRLP